MSFFPDFVPVGAVPDELVHQYRGVLPDQVLQVWQEDGFGSAHGGLLRVVNPEDWVELVEGTTHDFHRAKGLTPVFTTGLGDVVVSSEDGLVALRYRSGQVNLVISDVELFFTHLLPDADYREDAFDESLYVKAAERLGVPDFDEAFGYVPLLALGGSKRVENLQRVKLREHIDLIFQAAGPLL